MITSTVTPQFQIQFAKKVSALHRKCFLLAVHAISISPQQWNAGLPNTRFRLRQGTETSSATWRL